MKKRKKGLAYRSGWLFLVLFVILIVSVIGTSYVSIRNTLLQEYSKKIQTIVQMVAALVDGDDFKAYAENGIESDASLQIQKVLDSAKESDASLAFVYAYVPYEDYFIYVYDAKREGEDEGELSSFGNRFDYGKMEQEKLVPDIKNQVPSTDLIYGADVGFGESVSAWAPIFDSKNELVGMVEADYRLNDLGKIIWGRISVLLILLLIGLSLFLVIILFVMRKYITKPLTKLVQYVDSYEEGVFKEERFVYRQDDEIRWLGDSFDMMQGKIEEYIKNLTEVTAEKERIGAELDVATKIQASALPNIFPAYPDRKEFDLFASMDPAKEVGGDFYDFYMLDDDHLGIVIADVSGKGVPAALFMMASKIMLKQQASICMEPEEILTKVNNQLCENNEADMFVTVWFAILEISTGKVKAANAGHEYPAICRANGEFELFKDKHGFVLAGMEDFPYTQYEMELQPGDRLFVYTDGVPEATNGENELFGTDRMLEWLNKEKGVAPQALLQNVREGVDAFVKDAPQFDDLTMLALTYLGPQNL